MLCNRKIAVFIDVDNAALDSSQYFNVMSQLRAMGDIVCGTVYGVSERKHKKVIADCKNNGFTIQLPSRTRRRVRKVFDTRIYVDVATLLAQNAELDAVAVISCPDDMVYLFSHICRMGSVVISVDGLDEQSAAFVSATVDLSKVDKNQPATPASESIVATEDEEDRAAALLREIAKLLEGYDATATTPAPVAEEAVAEPVEQEEPIPGIVEETHNLMEKIAELSEASEATTPVADETDSTPRPSVSRMNSDLVRKIEELRRNNDGGDSEKLIAEIKKLLDSLED